MVLGLDETVCREQLRSAYSTTEATWWWIDEDFCSRPPATSTNTVPPNSLAKQYDADKERLIKSCFSKVDQTGQLLESYITHVRVTEDSHYPSARPPPDSPAANKKPRVIIIAVRKSGRVRMHKARENANGTFQIGKTWNLDDLTSVENDLQIPSGFTMHLGKPYYWMTGSPKEKTVFVSSAIRIYRKYRNGAVPTMIGWDASIGSPMVGQSPKFKSGGQGGHGSPAGGSHGSPGHMGTPPLAGQSPLHPGQSPLQPGQSMPLQPGQSQPIKAGHAGSPASGGFVGSPGSAGFAGSPGNAGYAGSPSKTQSSPYKQHTRGRSTASIGSAVSIGSASSAGNSIPGHGRRTSVISINDSPAPQSPVRPGISTSQSAHNVRSMVDPEPQGMSQSKSLGNMAGVASSEPMPKLDDHLLEQQRQAEQQQREQQRMSELRAEREAEQRLAQQREAERQEQQRLAEQQRQAEQQRAEQQRLEQQKQAEAEYQRRLELDRQERERQEKARLELQRQERERQERERKHSVSQAAAAASAAAASSAAVAAAISTTPGRKSSVADMSSAATAATPSRKSADVITIEDSPSPPTAAALENREPTIPVISVDDDVVNVEEDDFDMDSPNPAPIAPVVPQALAHNRSFSQELAGAGFVEEKPLGGSREPTREPKLPEFVVIDDKPAPAPPVQQRHQRNASQMSFESNLEPVDENKPVTRHQKKVSLSEPSSEGLPIVGSTRRDSNGSTGHRRNRSNGSLGSSRRLSRDLSAGGNMAPITYVGTSQADSTQIEDTLIELNWSGDKDAKELEADINRELAQLEESNIAHVIDLDTKFGDLTTDLDQAIAQCDELDAILTFFSVELGGLGSDIDYIESQGHGLQVQTTNQKILWEELNSILDTMSVPQREMEIIRRVRLDSAQDVAYAEAALVDLFAALASVRKMGSNSRDEEVFIGGMRALQERRSLYEQAAVDFIARAQNSLQEKVRDAVVNSSTQLSAASASPTIPGLISTVNGLYKYAGIVLFIRDVDPAAYSAILKQYERSARDYYEAASTAFFAKWKQQFKASDKTDQQSMFSPGREHETGEHKVSAVRQLTMKRSHSHQNVGQRKRDVSLSLSKNDKLQTSFSGIVEALQTALNSEQEVLIQLFHMTSFGASNYTSYIKQYPAGQRLAFARQVKKRGVDPDRAQTRAFATVLSGIFAPFSHECLTYFENVMESRPLECPTLFAVLDSHIEPMESTNQAFLLGLVNKIYDRSVNIWKTFVARQIDMISNTHVSCKRRSGVLGFVATFPEFCEKVEQQISGEKNGAVRTLVNDSYDKLGKAILHNLQRAADDVTIKNSSSGGTGTAIKMAASLASSSGAKGDEHEDKEILNYHILMVENMNCLMDALHENIISHSHVLIGHRDTAVSQYRTHLSEYSDNVLRRPFGKIIDYVQGVEALLKKDPSATPNQKHSYNKKALKAAISSCSPKDLRKVIDILRKRVEKHFGASQDDELATVGATPAYNDELLAKVWNALQAETISVFNRLTNIMNKYFADSSATNDITKAEIQAAFRR
ncbi:Exocyst complex component SEC3 [Yarrowia sp. B02]|nr:Exocyst complex component SEC3 [Yarrowia sp. B02]